MRIEEAIAYAKEQKEIIGGTHGEFLDAAIAALEKKVPRKVNDIDEYEWDELCGFCPRCNKLQSNLWSKKYCGDCGQRIDWSEVKK